jgi:hypothetical protein
VCAGAGAVLPCCSYWEQVAEYERRYAADIEELQQKLQNQAGSANREKVQSYLERINKVRGVLGALAHSSARLCTELVCAGTHRYVSGGSHQSHVQQ